MSENYFGKGFVPSSLTGGGLFPIMGCCAEPVDPVPLGKLLHCTVRIKMLGWPAGGGGGHFTVSLCIVSLCAAAPPICRDVNINAIAAMLMIALIRSFISAPFLFFNDALRPDARIGAWIEVVGREHPPTESNGHSLPSHSAP